MSGFSDGGAGADAVVARLEEQVARAQETARRAEQVREQFEQVRGRASSSRGEVRVVVETSGRLTALELSEDAMGLDRRDLAALVVSTAGAAQRQAAAQSLALVEDAFGAGSGVAGSLRAELARLVPEPGAERGDQIRWS